MARTLTEIDDALAAHESSGDNPHLTTQSQIGLIDTDNLAEGLVNFYGVTADSLLYSALTQSIGRINNPLVHIPLKNDTNLITGKGSLSFTRSTTATYVDRYGVVQSAVVNEARFEKEGLLIEGSSTNKLLNSNTFSSWVHSTPTPVTGFDDPTNGLDAWKLEDDNSGGDRYCYQAISVTASVAKYTFSIFMKQSTTANTGISVACTNTTYVVSTVNIEWSTLELTVQQGSGFDYGLEELVDGWVRITLAVENIDSTDIKVQFWPAGWQSTATGFVYVYGAQLEELPFASSYIPTTSAAVTRAADVCSLDYAGNMPAPNTEEMSVLCDVDLLGASDSLYQSFWRCYGEGVRLLRSRGLNDLRYYYGGSEHVHSITTPVTESNRIGVVYDFLNSYLYANGVERFVDIPSAVGPGLSSIAIGNSGGGTELMFGHISNFRIYDIALTEAEMKIA